MVLYYPVSSLVTLFANILQNPQDARSRSDLKLMTQVVNFLTSVGEDEETGGVKRMLGVCSEFERIAKVVLDKADKDSHSRRKRKINKDGEELLQPLVPDKHLLPRSPKDMGPTSPVFRPGFTGEISTPSFVPDINGYPSPNSNGEMPIMPDFMPGPGDFPNMMTEFNDMQQFGNPLGFGSPSDMSQFPQQSFVNQDLWQMPMSLEWDWTDPANNPFPGPGIDLGMNGVNGQHPLHR